MPRILIGACVLAVAATTAAVPAAADDTITPVTAQAETADNFDDDAGGNADADDPAIWVHPTRPGDSVVLGTLKNGGLTVFDLRGGTRQQISAPRDGRFNNVDVAGDLAVVTDRGNDRLRVYRIQDGRLTDVTVPAPPLLFNTEAEVEEQRTGYGLAVWQAGDGLPYVVVSRRHETRLGLFHLIAQPTGISYRPVATVDLPDTFGGWTPCADPGERPQVEGMVVDRTDGTLYAAQEDVGIWRIPLHTKKFGKPALVERVRSFGQPAEYDPVTEECVPTGPESPAAGEHLTADAEGLTIAYPSRTLIASSQGDSTFARYRLTAHGLRYSGGFRVVDGATDGVEHSDGAAITTTPLGRLFPHGLLVVHDGENTPTETDRPNTNFKLLPAP